MGSVGGPRNYHGAGLGHVTSWNCPTCGTPHTTRIEDGCPVCLAEDARRVKSVAGAVEGVDKLAPHLLITGHGVEENDLGSAIRLDHFSEQARQTMAAALAHFVEHGAPDATLLPKAVMIGWARELAGLSEG